MPTSSVSTDTGLLQSSTNNLAGAVSTYSYDKGEQLTGATNVDGHHWGCNYDADTTAPVSDRRGHDPVAGL